MEETNKQEFSEIIHTIGDLKHILTKLQGQLRSIEKRTSRKMKTLSKKVKKNENKGKKKPSGFAKPTKISNDLCDFFNIPRNSEMARTDVTKQVISYIKEHNLQKLENKQHIIPDEKLITLLDINKDDTLTYFNLQKYMNIHFIK
jgi:chromatin remodeling complex protein RSC6